MRIKYFGFAIALMASTSLLEAPTSAGWKCCKVKIKNPLKTVEKVVRDTGKAVGKAAGDVAHTAEKAAQDTGNTIEIAAQDTGKTLEKAGRDVSAESKRGVANVAEFGEAIGRYTGRIASDTKDNLTDAEKRLREGKVADAFWHLAVDPISDTEERAAKLAQESSLANTVGQVAASTYGGPGGAAAYAAWYTYRSTGNAELALKVGIISGATSAAMSSINAQPSMADASAAARAGTATVSNFTVAETAKKAALAGAVGGLAVAASGGDANAVRDAFLMGGGMVLIQDGFKAYTGQQGMYTEGAERPAFCTTSLPVNGQPGSACAPPADWFKRNESGKLVLDMSKVPPDTSYVGLATDTASTPWPSNLINETGRAMNVVATVPGLNAMSIFHDQWVISWDMSGPAVQATIIPAVVLTYMGTEAPLQNLIQDSAAGNSAASPPPAAGSSTSPASSATSAQASSQVVNVWTPPNGGSCTRRVRLIWNTKITIPCLATGDVRPTTVSPTYEQSYIAFKGEQSRTFFVARGEDKKELACVLVYQRDAGKGGEDLAPWYAINDQEFCDRKAWQLAQQHVDNGWQVLVR